MTATALDRATRTRTGEVLSLAVYQAMKIPAGVMVQANATGYAVNASATIANRTLGISTALADNSAGASGDIKVDVRRKIVGIFGNSAAGDLITIADIGNNCYVVDNQTVAKTSDTGARPVAGKIVDVDAQGVHVEFG